MDSLSAQVTQAATAVSARPVPEVSARTAQDDDQANEAPAVATSEDQATPPPKKTRGASIDIFV
ncbi:MAG: hypothetical protein FJX55_10435 [Alphaproteobacteria bacterium]|nr:hypothetical protein [Alphaproteobacteria bacterium]